MQFVHYVVANCGDGSSVVEFYKGQELESLQEYCLAHPDRYPDPYISTMQFPESFDLYSLNIWFTYPYDYELED